MKQTHGSGDCLFHGIIQNLRETRTSLELSKSILALNAEQLRCNVVKYLRTRAATEHPELFNVAKRSAVPHSRIGVDEDQAFEEYLQRMEKPGKLPDTTMLYGLSWMLDINIEIFNLSQGPRHDNYKEVYRSGGGHPSAFLTKDTNSNVVYQSVLKRSATILCKACGMDIPSSEKTDHMKVCCIEKHSCNLCLQEFDTKKSKTTHMYAVHGGKSECPNCGKEYSKKNLNRHELKCKQKKGSENLAPESSHQKEETYRKELKKSAIEDSEKHLSDKLCDKRVSDSEPFSSTSKKVSSLSSLTKRNGPESQQVTVGLDDSFKDIFEESDEDVPVSGQGIETTGEDSEVTPQSFMCRICETEFGTQTSLWTHNFAVHSSKQICTICNEEVTKKMPKGTSKDVERDIRFQIHFPVDNVTWTFHRENVCSTIVSKFMPKKFRAKNVIKTSLETI